MRTSKYFYQLIIFRFAIIEWKWSKTFLNYLWSDFQSWKTYLTYKSFSKLIFIVKLRSCTWRELTNYKKIQRLQRLWGNETRCSLLAWIFCVASLCFFEAVVHLDKFDVKNLWHFVILNFPKVSSLCKWYIYLLEILRSCFSLPPLKIKFKSSHLRGRAG